MSARTPGAPDANPGAFETLVLGIGNILWADEGFGIRAVETLHEGFAAPESVRVMDGGTQGVFLLPWVRGATRMLIFDAVDFGLPPATLRLIRGDDVPRFMGVKKMSMHQAGFQEVLSTAQLTGDLPDELALIGVQPALLDDYGGSLTPGVKAQILPAIALACEVLRDWGVALTERSAAPACGDIIGPDVLAIHPYESGRPLIGRQPS